MQKGYFVMHSHNFSTGRTHRFAPTGSGHRFHWVSLSGAGLLTLVPRTSVSLIKFSQEEKKMETKIVRIITVSFMLTALLVALPLSGLGGRTPKAEAATLSGNWASLGLGFNNVVYAVAVSGTNVYVGGAFTQICGNATCNSGNITATHIAMWNGSSWSPVSLGVNNAVYAVVVSGTKLYAGGRFRLLCGDAGCNSNDTPVNRVAMWNGAGWSSVGNGVGPFPSDVNALALIGTNLYAGGTFTQICGNATCDSGNTTANDIAMWNGG